MTARQTYEATVKSAAQTQYASLISAESAKQETINASGVNVGYNLQFGNNVNFVAAVKSANQAKWLATYNAEHAKQVAINAARDTLRASGDLAPA